MQIAIVGSGPAGLYTAKKLLDRIPCIKIALFEKEFLPFGLVRSGVAPDHPELRSLRAKFADILRDERIFFYGSDLQFDWSSASNYFDCLIDSRGASEPNRIHPLNYSSQNIADSQDFVKWILGMNASEKISTSLFSARSISVIGLGNVALDVARFLISSLDDYKNLEIGDEAVRYLGSKRKHSTVRIFGRRACSDVQSVC